MAHTAQPLPFRDALIGISEKTIAIHHDKLYVGYVNKLNEVEESLSAMRSEPEILAKANQSFSALRALRMGETFAANGVYLHEYYFNVLGGNGNTAGELVSAIEQKWGSMETFISMFSASAMAVRGWVVLAWDIQAQELKIYGCDSHNQGGVWGCLPILVLDVYEHAYFIDYGSDRGAYIKDFWKNLHWEAATRLYNQAKTFTL